MVGYTLLADGASGTTSGRVVSEYAVKRILHSFYTADNPDVKARLLEAIQQANADIFEQNQQHPERRVSGDYADCRAISRQQIAGRQCG